MADDDSSASGEFQFVASATNNLARRGIMPLIRVLSLWRVKVFEEMAKELPRHCSGRNWKNSETGTRSQPISPPRDPRVPFAPPYAQIKSAAAPLNSTRAT